MHIFNHVRIQPIPLEISHYINRKIFNYPLTRTLVHKNTLCKKEKTAFLSKKTAFLGEKKA